MFGWLYNLLGNMLAWFESFTGTYALALLFYALIFKVLFLPFSIKQQKNQIAMAKLAPKIELIKAKYKGRTDRPTLEKQQMEIMELQRSEGYSPFSGCLPLLIQLPLIILLYNVIQKPLAYIADYPTIDNVIVSEELSESEKIEQTIADIYNFLNPPQGEGAKPVEYKDIENGQIQLISQINAYINANAANAAEFETKFGIDIKSIPDFVLFGVNLAEEPSLKADKISILVIIPVLAAAVQWISMWLTRKINGNPAMAGAQDAQTQASMKMMDLVMPLMTLFLAFNFSGMLGIYWVYQSGLGLLQTVILAKVMPLPKYTEEELKAMRKAQKAAEKAQRAAIKEQPKYKSLHYIDEDDYDTLPEVKSNQQASNKDKSSGIDIP